MAPLKCPLCCETTFQSHNSLKDHVLVIMDKLENLECPSCKKQCNLIDLPDHLEQQCENIKANSLNVKDSQKVDKINSTNLKKEIQSQREEEQFPNCKYDLMNVKMETTTVENTNNEVDDASQSTIKDEAITEYNCEMCNMTFASVEEHLVKYHEGEEVILETQETNVTENHYSTNEDVLNELENSFDDTMQEDSERAESQTEETDCSVQEQILDTTPLITKYLVEDGKLCEITEEQVNEIADETKIIEIHCCRNCKLQFPNFKHFEQHNCKGPDPSDNPKRQTIRKPKKTTSNKHRASAMNKKIEEIRYQCSFCMSVYDTLKKLNDHMKIHLAEDEDNEIPRKTIMSIHICDICQTKFPTYKQLRLHLKMHEPIQSKELEENLDPEHQFKCEVCNKIYSKEYEEVHMKSHEDQKQFLCLPCNRKFDSKDNLELHTKAHSTAEKFVCSYCKKSFTNYGTLEGHMKNECQQRDFVCSYCERRFSKAHEKVKHERIHTGEKPHVCNICGKAFRVTYCLTLHMRTHTGSRPYTCNICGKKFKSHAVYTHHMKTHSEDRNYKCPFCPKAFKTAVQLAGHKNSHTKPFSCTKCCRPFSSLFAVRTHMETHKRNNNLRFSCFICGAVYARAFALKDHLSTFHGHDVEKNQDEKAVKELEESENFVEQTEASNAEIGIIETEVCHVQVMKEEEEGYVVHLPDVENNGLIVEENHMEVET